MLYLVAAAIGSLLFLLAAWRGYCSYCAYQRYDRHCDGYLVQALALFILSLSCLITSAYF